MFLCPASTYDTATHPKLPGRSLCGDTDHLESFLDAHHLVAGERTQILKYHNLLHYFHTPHPSNLRSIPPTNTPILRLPRKKVQQRRKRLPHQTKADPENAIPHNPPISTLHLLERNRGPNHRELDHHSHERDAEDVVRWYTDQQLVQEAGEDEDHCAGGVG